MSPEMVNYVWIVAGFFSILVVMGILWWLLKTYVFAGGPSLFGNRERRRLGLVEWASIGGGRQLLLVRRDEVEHLILTGGPIDVVVESGIGKEASTGAAADGESARSARDDALRARSERPRFEEPAFEFGLGRGAESAASPRDGGGRRPPDGVDGRDSERFLGIGASFGEKAHRAAASEQKD